ncbi:tyrosine-type recombinase/integrase, partial [Couchioplanes caeruleus]|uniref:tyrosine-type recombinase/integrase n=1 Tax=Couchioplanes caeruleus TaxID=56438 RepID=UPI000A73FAAE
SGRRWHHPASCDRPQRGLPEVPLHHMRHGAASLHIQAGVDIAVISKRLGHSGISLTSDTYGHLIETVDKTAAEAAATVVPCRLRWGIKPRSPANP